AYAAGHIPGAVRIEEGPLRNSEDPVTYLPRPEAVTAILGRAGIGNRTHVVAYDDQGGKSAARLWHVLNAYGDSRVSLLNGGWNKWVAEQRPTTTDVPEIQPATFTPKATPTMSCPSSEILSR